MILYPLKQKSQVKEHLDNASLNIYMVRYLSYLYSC